MDNFAIIVAGGTGTRMETETPKQFLLLAGKPLLMHSMEAFFQFDEKITIIVSLHPDYMKQWMHLCAEYDFHIPHFLVPGGSSRFHSVQNALGKVPGSGLVAVHDAARPLITVSLIRRIFKAAANRGNAIPCVTVNETVRSMEGGSVKLLDRSLLRITQTPEVFECSLLKNAYEQPYQPGFTDDGSLLEARGMQVHLVDGDPVNIKITLPGDVEIAEVLLRRRITE